VFTMPPPTTLPTQSLTTAPIAPASGLPMSPPAGRTRRRLPPGHAEAVGKTLVDNRCRPKMDSQNQSVMLRLRPF
jgi:hypothetical protein